MSEWAHSMEVSVDDAHQWWVDCQCGAKLGPFRNEDDADDEALNHRDDMETP